MYRDATPDAAEIIDRRERYWRPYHQALALAVATALDRHGHALLWDAHSISAVVPRLFDGTLPDLNMGTADGAACGAAVSAAAFAVCGASPYTAVLNGRFKGGYITRAYGRPADGVHAIQMELAKSTHLGADHGVDAALAARLRPVLRDAIGAAVSALA